MGVQFLCLQTSIGGGGGKFEIKLFVIVRKCDALTACRNRETNLRNHIGNMEQNVCFLLKYTYIAVRVLWLK